jgi:hypothetical protein
MDDIKDKDFKHKWVWQGKTITKGNCDYCDAVTNVIELLCTCKSTHTYCSKCWDNA